LIKGSPRRGSKEKAEQGVQLEQHSRFKSKAQFNCGSACFDMLAPTSSHLGYWRMATRAHELAEGARRKCAAAKEYRSIHSGCVGELHYSITYLYGVVETFLSKENASRAYE
jgi:hypothetical protein